MELAAASDNSERFLLENAALQDRVATLEKNLQDTRGLLLCTLNAQMRYTRSTSTLPSAGPLDGS